MSEDYETKEIHCPYCGSTNVCYWTFSENARWADDYRCNECGLEFTIQWDEEEE
jgi:DNA-directed RNA polymerase subunit RPC12/RpoP